MKPKQAAVVVSKRQLHHENIRNQVEKKELEQLKNLLVTGKDQQPLLNKKTKVLIKSIQKKHILKHLDV